ncbi:MAG: DUF2834 domain-containing protein [Sandaracinaceae bacterium]|nr:DUF2834 domain-containing protein [Sandaracinaceae bacterium]
MKMLEKIGLAVVLLSFVALTAWAAYAGSSAEQLEALFTNPWGIQISVDLCIAATFAIRWMWRDAKERGIAPLPWALAVIPTGSLALLAYAVRRRFAPTPAARARLATA